MCYITGIMNKSVNKELDDGAQATLLSWVNSGTTEQRFVTRGRIILMLNAGATFSEIRKSVQVSDPTIVKWKQRFLAAGIDGLQDRPRSGKPRVYGEAKRNIVVQRACEKPSGGYSSWSQRRIAEDVGISQSQVCEILKEHRLRPHKVEYWCGKSTDPEFEEKMLNIVGLYMNPPENAIVLCVDEKTQIQALDRSQPELPMKPDKPRRQTVTYKRNGTVSLIASLAVHSGEITGQTVEKNNSESFLRFLKRLDRTYTRKHLHVIVDNLAVHKHKDVKAWLEKKRKFTVHYTPTYSSWLNQIEIWFNIMTKDVLNGAVWTSKKQLAAQIIEYIKTYNSTRAKPFQWTYDGTK